METTATPTIGAVTASLAWWQVVSAPLGLALHHGDGHARTWAGPPAAGLEPATLWLTGEHFCQLSESAGSQRTRLVCAQLWPEPMAFRAMRDPATIPASTTTPITVISRLKSIAGRHVTRPSLMT